MDSIPYIPKRDDGTDYELRHLTDAQKVVAFMILDKIKEWLQCTDFSTFEPLRCTLDGKGGTGKSVVINTVVSVIRRATFKNDTVAVAAPTGTAAFNVNGVTVHSLTSQSPDQMEKEYNHKSVGPSKREKLVKKNKDLLFLAIDERSLMPTRMLGNSEMVIAETVYQGLGPKKHSFGGVPVVMVSGDDYQLCGSFGESAMDALPGNSTQTSKKSVLKGRQLYMEMAQNVLHLPTIQRIQKGRENDRELLDRIRIGENVSDEDATRLMNLRLDKIRERHGDAAVDDIKKKSIFLCYTNKERLDHNIKTLVKMNSAQQPTAILKPRSLTSSFGKTISSHFKDSAAKTALLCKNAKVCLQGRNFHPIWGLHNGACGTVKEIIFESGQSPNHGNLPSYVVIDFPLYRGPAWDTDNPTHVPIPMCTDRCKVGCCTKEYAPFDLCFARTIHRYQGLEAGPKQKGKPACMNECIICDPGDLTVEGKNPGIFYTATSRATTFGDENGLNSAIYFSGKNLTKQRIQRLTKCKTRNQEYIKVTKRRKWSQYLEKKRVQPPTKEEMSKTFAYFRGHFKKPISYNKIYSQKMRYCMQATNGNKQTNNKRKRQTDKKQQKKSKQK